MTNGYYIGTKEEAENYDNIVTQGEGYNGTTTRWAEPRQHPTQLDLYSLLSTQATMTLCNGLKF